MSFPSKDVNAEAQIVAAAIRVAIEPLEMDPLSTFIGLLSAAGGAALTILQATSSRDELAAVAGVFARNFETVSIPFRNISKGLSIGEAFQNGTRTNTEKG